STTSSRSTSSKTMTGAWPPSSRGIFFGEVPASCASARPTGVDPGKETLRTTGDAIMAAEICAASPQITFTTPGGIPASSQHFAIAYALSGVSLAGLTITEQPAPRLLAILRPGSIAGRFQGETANTGP